MRGLLYVLKLCFVCCCVPCCAVLAAGKLTDTRQRFLGTRPPRLFSVSVRGERSLLALSSRPWLGYSDMGRWQFMPLSYEALDHAAVRLYRERLGGDFCRSGSVALSCVVCQCMALQLCA